MIKAEDLRIGDLVRYGKDIITILATHADGLVCFADGKDQICVEHVLLEPIPLTPEILEKNGWKRISHKGLPWALFRKKGCSVRIAYDSDDDKVPFSVGKEIQELKNINYVHELQHILWALGKDANLKI